MTFSGQPREAPPTKQDYEDGEAVLQAVFGPARDPKLADIVVYFKDIKRPPLVFLMQGKTMRRVLDREAQAWVVILLEKGDAECPKALLRLEGVGAAQLEAGVSVDGAMAAMLMRKDQDSKALVPDDKFIETQPSEIPGLGGKEWCSSATRFELSANSLNRLIIYPGKAKPSAEPQQIEKIKMPGCTSGQALTASCNSAKCPPSNAQSPAEPTPAEPTPAEPRKPAELTTFFNFANSRSPLHIGSIAIGFHPFDLSDGRSCTRAGWCRPSVYAFGHLYTLMLGAGRPAEWNLPPALSISFPVVGIRLLDPVFGDIVAGLRIGAEDRLSHALSRFGIIAGASYVFTDRTAEKAGGDAPEVRTTLTRWRFFTALDFAF
jgi:hypothetical protein